MNRFLIAIFAIGAFGAGSALADTTDQTWMNKVELQKTGPHCADDKNCFNRYHPNIPPAAKANPGDMIILHTRDGAPEFAFCSDVPHGWARETPLRGVQATKNN